LKSIFHDGGESTGPLIKKEEKLHRKNQTGYSKKNQIKRIPKYIDCRKETAESNRQCHSVKLNDID
jgi:hypothetical protein